MKRVLVLGVGNLLQSDDGLGVHIVNSIIDSNMILPDYVEIIDGGTSGYDLLPVMKDREKIIIVDALKSDDKPGSIYKFSSEYLAPERTTFSLHDTGIKQIIDMLRIMGDNPLIEIIGVVPEDIETCNIGLSRAVEDSIPKVVEEIRKALAQ